MFYLRALTVSVIAVFVLVACGAPGDATFPELRLPPAAASAHPAASCGLCADVSGKNAIKKLCAQSAAAWDALVACACTTKCGAECGADWCARLDNVTYTNASDACNNCIVAQCYPELMACSTAQ